MSAPEAESVALTEEELGPILRLPTNGKVIIKAYLPDSGTRNALDLANGGQKPGTPIKLLAYTGNFNQQWWIGIGPRGGTTFKNAMGDTYLGFEKNDLVVRSLAAGTYTPTEFSIYRGAKGWNIQLLQDASLVLDAQWRETDPPVPVWLYPRNYTVAQEWTFDYI